MENYLNLTINERINTKSAIKSYGSLYSGGSYLVIKHFF